MSNEAQKDSKFSTLLLFILILAAVLAIFSEVRASNNLVLEFSRVKDESIIKSVIIQKQAEIIQDQINLISLLEYHLDKLQKSKAVNLAANKTSE